MAMNAFWFSDLTRVWQAAGKLVLAVWVLCLTLLLAVILSPREKPHHYFIFTELIEWLARKKKAKDFIVSLNCCGIQDVVLPDSCHYPCCK